ncbi:MAG TPA: L-seryl-tRNA(Sec) selenium transferase, partial [Planctomycetota bacterium]|nr:L-seryl-tRNA(Sec) selenium transferase [Planctomycetota bacterium]
MSRLLEARPVALLVRRLGHELVRDLLRERLAELRDGVRGGALAAAELERAVRPQALAAEVARRAAALTSVGPQVVINATGVIVHTNLGRAVLSDAAAERVAATARSYVDLEYDLGRGRRGSRLEHLAPLVARLFPGF